MKQLFTFIFLSVIAFSCTRKASVQIQVFGKDHEFAFAKEELINFLSDKYSINEGENTNYQITLEQDSTMAPFSFSVNSQKENNSVRFVLKGHSTTDVLCAMYSLLEKAGMRFEITGPLFQKSLDLGLAVGYNEIFTPRVQRRGIRQHINFPMDISSYPLVEAKEYIRNLVRMRFNYITFHSYAGIWYADPLTKEESYAGNFFYNKLHRLPAGYPFASKLRNDSIFCIPEIEPYFNNLQKRGELAQKWLGEVIREADRVGLSIGFSYEPRIKGTNVDTTFNTAAELLKLYPGIDDLELITTETSHWFSPMSNTETNNMLARLFGTQIKTDPVVQKPVQHDNPGIGDAYAQIGHNIKALSKIDSLLLKKAGKNGRLGHYIASPEFVEAAHHLFKKYAPSATYAAMPGHGSSRVARYLPHASMSSADWQKTMIYSWLEFDGLMYLQQNGVRGIRHLIEQGDDICPSEPFYGICFNHWRTGENRVTARYAAEVTLKGSIEESDFYRNYAHTYQIQEVEKFSECLKKINEADLYATENLWNVGFSYALKVYSQGFGFIGMLSPENLSHGEKLYEEAHSLLRVCWNNELPPEAKELLSLLDNRLRSTIIYLKAFRKGTEIQRFDINNLTNEDKAKIAEIINQSISGFEQYINLYGDMIVDRGCEGTMISAYYVRIDALKKIRENICGIPYQQKYSDETSFEPPPPPIMK